MVSKRNHSALPVIKRVRNADKTEESKPESVNSSARAYFQSIRPRTESAVWASESPSANCTIEMRANCAGAAAGWRCGARHGPSRRR